MAEKKYIFVNGVMKLNPAYKAEQAKVGNPTTLAAPDKALAVVSSTDDIQEANALHESHGSTMPLSETTEASMAIMMDEDFSKQFRTSKPLETADSTLLDQLSKVFAQYEVPIGLINKLLVLSQQGEEYKLNFIIDDSGSMNLDSDVNSNEAGQIIKEKRNAQGISKPFLSRWEEVEDRLHSMINILAYIPSDTISLSFLNRKDELKLSHTGKTPTEFADEAHQKIKNLFNVIPNFGTPIYSKLSRALAESTGRTMHYLFTDGEPNDVPLDRNHQDDKLFKLKELILTRNNPKENALTFMSCTNNDKETEWMKELDEVEPRFVNGVKIENYISEIDDFNDERDEVLAKQGVGFPYTKGMWLINQLVSAINPDDLDKMDEKKPFTRDIMDNILGHKLSDSEYSYYLQNNPYAKNYPELFQKVAPTQHMQNFQTNSNYANSSSTMWNAPQQQNPQYQQQQSLDPQQQFAPQRRM